MSQLTIQQAFELAVRHHQAGQLQQAEQICRQILVRQPEHADVLHLLGVIAYQSGRTALAVDLFRQAIARNPHNPEAHCNLGGALKDRGQLDAAIAACRQALTLNPRYPEAYSNLGNALHARGQLDAAIAACRQALTLRPHYPTAYSNLGNALRDKGQLDEAIAAFRQVIALNPHYPEAHLRLGMALKDKGQLDDAVAAFRQALALNPNHPQAYNNLGLALRILGRRDEAIAAYRQALALNPKYVDALNNLGIALKDMGRLDEAGVAFRQALALNPQLPEIHSNLGVAFKDMGQLDAAIADYRQALALKPDYADAHSNLLLTLHYHPASTAASLGQEARRWNLQHAAPLKPSIRPHTNDRNPERRLRIGYVSPDFRQHSVGRFALPLLAHHDKTQVEVFAYAQVAAPDAMTERLRSYVDGWRSLVGLADAQAADLIRQDGIDILVDLTMHTVNNRLLVFAHKPAPVQVTYLAYCSTTGLETIDYRLSDPYLDPPGMDESVYSEQTIRLPETYWCYQPIIAPPEVCPLPALERGHITFGCLNNFCKVSEPTLTAWSKVLQAVPNSQLLLHAHEGSHRQRVLDRFQHDGIDSQRIRFTGLLPIESYFDLHRQLDIALDTFPYGGGTTTCDALWMGVPVVSLVGQTAVDRGGLSLLSNLGLPELAARSEETYIRIATDLAHDLPRLANLRATLRRRMEQSPLMDAPRFARNIEAAYRQMWRQWCTQAPILR